MLAILGTMTSCSVAKVGGVPAKVDYVYNTNNKTDNYIMANEWMVESFNNAESVIQFSDKDAGIVKGKYVLHFTPAVYAGYLSTPEVKNGAIITIKVKDSVAKITIDASSEKFYPVKVDYYYNIADAGRDINRLIEDFKQTMSKSKEEF